ncbi:MAG: HlyD family type I secretion periplasmic adaptor subunit [Paracoccaceae bacterium]|uniref:HlyD family type I secretion periplasmic adaptor subunit n=1 Tax=Seohaeicola saemankumensis TaxID=481181 RepID=UPI001E2E265D|nr:HlyD family type I secretion periplasmic adaptor subunit [Seohaeicola saemankumensis]MCD1625688.1 HlyD family type I secretion periplasmic adaptor subunit [Seohaeicola saemankumensis]
MQGNSDLHMLARELRGRSSWRSSLLLLTILAFIVIALFWAAVTEIDDVTRGDGRIVPSQNIQFVQATEAGVLEALHVAEGDIVAPYDLLMELDRTLMSSQLDQERQRAVALMARIARLDAELAEADTLVMPDDLVRASPSVAASEVALFAARRDEFDAEREVLERQRVQRQQDYEEGLVDQTIAEETLLLVAQEMDLIGPLVSRQLEPETTLLTLRRSHAEWQGRKVRSDAALVRLKSALDEIDDRIAALRARLRAEARAELALATGELAELQTRLPALEQRVTRAELRAPVRGIVNRIMLTTLGGVAQAGDTLIEIVPMDDVPLVEAYLRPSDIAFLYPGQPVKVRITAYDASRYGSLDGEILRIGATAVTRPDRDEQAFVVQIRTFSNLLDAEGAAVEIVPGMVTEVDILAGRKTVLDYILRPVVRVKERALRD